MIKVAILGYGNIGKAAEQSILNAPDMELAGIYHHSDCLDDIQADVVLVCTPTREILHYANLLLAKGISTVDSFDIHSEIYTHMQALKPIAMQHGAVSIVSAGWDPGTDSLIRTIMLAMTPEGQTYTNFGPGRSMGHTVAAKAIQGVRDAVSITIPIGEGKHQRDVYIQLEEGEDLQTVQQRIVNDDYFAHDPINVIKVDSVLPYDTHNHGVLIQRQGIASNISNQQLSFAMTINNPALTAQIMVSCARAAIRMKASKQYGAFTTIHIPPIYFLPLDEEQAIRTLV
jgi:diaminopimelate dehydrogenase